MSEQAWNEWRVLHGRLSPRENSERQKKEKFLRQQKKEWQNPFGKTPSQEITIQKSETDAPQPAVRREGFYPVKPQANYAEPVPPAYLCYPTKPQKSWYSESQYERAYATWRMEDQNIEAENQARYQKYVAAITRWNPEWTEAVKLGESLKIRKLRFARPQDVSLQEVTIQEAPKQENTNPSEYTIPTRDVQYYAQRHPAIQKPAAYKITTPIERFTKWVDSFLERNQTCLDGHWLPAGPLSYVFASDAITIGLCRQIADTIESKGYCVEPDARFGSVSSPEEFRAHLREITKSQPDAVALARLMPNKAVEKFDDFAPEQLLDEANARSRLDISGAVEACKHILEAGSTDSLRSYN